MTRFTRSTEKRIKVNHDIAKWATRLAMDIGRRSVRLSSLRSARAHPAEEFERGQRLCINHPRFDMRANYVYVCILDKWKTEMYSMATGLRFDKEALRAIYPEVYRLNKDNYELEGAYKQFADEIKLNWVYNNVLKNPFSVIKIISN